MHRRSESKLLLLKIAQTRNYIVNIVNFASRRMISIFFQQSTVKQ